MATSYRKYQHGKIPFQEATKCIFCGSPPPLTDEHIFSRWTHRFLPPRSMRKYKVMRVETHLERSDRHVIKRLGDIRDWQIKCVCDTKCNNGWMRKQIEDVARPIMTPLINGDEILRGATFQISPQHQKIIAAWAALKAMVAEYDSNSWVTTHHTQRKYLQEKLSPPDGWAIWIGAYPRGNWLPHWISTPFLHLSRKQEMRRGANIRATYYNSHISTQVIGQLFIHVIRSPARKFVKGWSFSPPEKGSLFRIWPPSTYSIKWPGKFLSDRDADYVAGALYFFILDRLAPEFRAPLLHGAPANSRTHTNKQGGQS